MSSHENTSTFQESQKLPITQEIFSNSSTLNKIPEEKEENNKLIRPIPINIKVIKKPKSELTTMQDSSLTIKNVVKELKMPIMYPNVNYAHLAQNGIYINELNYQSGLKNGNKYENNEIYFKKDKPCCSCTKTKCIKKYCECFANNKYCVDCLCQNCMNKLTEINPIQNSNSNNSIIEFENEKNKVICTCTKSNCCKKYCECFKIGKKCSSKCRCLNCMNMDPKYMNQNKNNNLISDVIYKNNINSEDKNILLNKSSECESIDDTFKIQRISVFINKYQTEINVEKLSKEELNLLCKKRKHN